MANTTDTSDLGEAVQEVTEKLSLLFREEVELAKTEMTEKVTKLLKGAVIGIVAGIFAVFGLIYLLEGAAWAIWLGLDGDGNNFWVGFVIVAVLLFILGALAGFLAARLIKRGAPPTPQMAIEEGKLIKETVTTSHPAIPQGPSD
jgi:uncharacterized membrane protein YqjE